MSYFRSNGASYISVTHNGYLHVIRTTKLIKNYPVPISMKKKNRMKERAKDQTCPKNVRNEKETKKRKK